MKKDKKFLLDLENRLSSINKNSRDTIVLKYRKIIDEKINNKEKITNILKELGSVDEIAKKEIEIYNNSKKKGFKNVISFITKDIQLPKREKKEKIKKEKIKKEKIKKEKVKKEKISIEEPKEEKIVEEQIELVNENIIDEDISNTEDVNYKKRKLSLRIMGIVLITLIIFIWLWESVVTLASFFLILDGVRFFGISIALIGFNILIAWLTLLSINTIYKKKYFIKLKVVSIITSLVFIVIGVSLFIYEIYKVDCVSDVSEKYSMQKQIETFSLPSDASIKTYVIFNANYDIQYMINYDEKLDGKFKVEVDYYEAYYDYYSKKSSNNIYISLRKDRRDMISTYISDLKENKVYSKDELLRYTVKITINKKDYSRLIIED